jgi:hypothetical protein
MLRAPSPSILPWLAAGLLLLLVSVAMAADAPRSTREAAVQWAPTPRAERLPIRVTNRPFLAANRAQLPVDLAVGGYVEEEVLVSGRSNLYDWGGEASAVAVVSGAGESWTTRMLVRRPVNAARFSGRIVLELLDATDQVDTAPLWGMSQSYFMRAGDAWVGLTVRPAALRTLRTFDSIRYAKLSLPVSASLRCQASAAGEGGLTWDLIAQAGALVRSASRENPLATLHPQRVILAGHGDAGSLVVTYANTMNARWRQVDGAPLFDGYLDVSGDQAAPLNPCAAALPGDDPRHGVLPRDVPFVAARMQGDLEGGHRLPVQRADSDAPGDVFRYFELAGAPRSGSWPAGLPARADLQIAGLDARFDAAAACRSTPSDYPVGMALNALWRQYETLVLMDEPMIQAPRIEVDTQGAPLRDEQGNAVGGWRLPLLDVPLAVYSSLGAAATEDDSNAARNACAQLGSMSVLEPAQLKQLYGNRANYLKRFDEAIGNAVDGRRLLDEDAKALKSAVSRKVPVF